MHAHRAEVVAKAWLEERPVAGGEAFATLEPQIAAGQKRGN
jgi:hypothetical protein